MSLSVLAVALDGTVLSVALPTLAVRLHASEADLQWFSSAYLLVLAAAMLPAGLAGDRWGRKRVLTIALALFGTGSAACAVSSSAAEFIAARVLLGIAGAGVIVMALSALATLFDEAERPRAVGVWSAANFLAMPIGPIVGGWMLSHIWWGWVFLMNVPVVGLGLVAVGALVPETRLPGRPSLDLPGLVASAGGFVALTYGSIAAGQHGWGNPIALVAIGGGLLALAGFVMWERTLSHRPGGRPLVDPALFRSRSYTWGVIVIAVLVLAMMGVLFTLPQFFQGVEATDAMGSGVRLLALVGGLVTGALPADRLARHLGDKLTVASGLGILAAGVLLGASTTTGSSAGFVAIWTAIVGTGMGIALATASAAALSELSEERAAIGSAVLQAVNKLGGPLGTALLGSILSSGYVAGLHLSGLPRAAALAARESIFAATAVASRLHDPALLESARAAFATGMDAALMASAVVVIVALALALLFLPGARKSATEQPA